MTNTQYPLGIDISRWNSNSELTKHPDFDQMVRGGVKFVAMRAGISWGYKDPTFDRNWGEARRVLLPRIAYHVPYFHQPVNSQSDHLLRIVDGGGVNWDNDRLALDLELAGGQSRNQITDVTCGMIGRLKSITGRYPILYSRANWVDTYMVLNELLKNADWWLAHYLAPLPAPQYTPEKKCPPLLPKGVNSWLIHQTTEKGNGGAVGTVSYYVDINRWNGTLEQMYAYFGMSEPVEPDPDDPPEVPPSTELYRAKVTATIGLKIRSGAGLNYPQVGSLKYKQEVSVYEERNGWLRVDPHRQWWSSGEWLERITDVHPSTMFYGALFGQRDPRWIREPLGTKSTIGAHGCLMTCAAIVAGTNPHELNQWLTANGGYQDGNLFLWAKLEEFKPTLRFEGFTYNPTDNDIKAKLTAEIMPILLVDFDERTPMQDMHWVVAIGIDTEGYVIIHDPWTDDIIRLRDRYKKPLLRFGSYRRQA